MKICFPYGKSFLMADIPSENLIPVNQPNPLVAVEDPDQTIADSLDHPLFCDKIEKMVNPSSKVSVVISDITRPIPNRRIIPRIMEILTNVGVSARNVKLVVAPGGHRKQTYSELAQMLGDEIVGKLQVVSHDCLAEGDMVYLGET